MKLYLLFASIFVTTFIYAADSSRENWARKYPVIKPTSLRDIAPISEQFLKEEIRKSTLPAIRQRMQEAISKMNPETEGWAPSIVYLTITRTFKPSSTDDLSKMIYDIVTQNESSDFVSGPSTAATPCDIDLFTRYKKIPRVDGMYTIKCTTQLTSKEYIEEIIADM